MMIYISEPNVYKNITITSNKGISILDQRKSLNKVQGLDQKTQMVLSRVFSYLKI